MLLVILLILAAVVLFGGFGYRGGAYRNQGVGIVAVLVFVLLILWVAGVL